MTHTGILRGIKTPREKHLIIVPPTATVQPTRLVSSTIPELTSAPPKLKLTTGLSDPSRTGPIRSHGAPSLAPTGPTRSHTPSLMGGIVKEQGGFHKCNMCGNHFLNLFNYHRHILRQHWFETQKQFSEEHFLFKKIDGLTEKQCTKLRELHRKLKDRNSPTPPKRSRRSRPYGTVTSSEQSNNSIGKEASNGYNHHGNGARVSQLKEYKLVTVNDMADAYKDKYSNPGGYTIFHFKVPKKNCNSASTGGVINPPALTALKKTYNSSGDKKSTQRTEKIPITDSQPLSSWHQKTFESHLSHSLAVAAAAQASTSSVAADGRTLATTSATPHPIATTSATPHPLATTKHSGKCSTKGCKSSRCKKASSSSSGKYPVHFSSPLAREGSMISCTDILHKIVHSPESIQKPQISLTVEDKEAKVDVMTVDLSPTQLSSSNTSTHESPRSSTTTTSTPATNTTPLPTGITAAQPDLTTQILEFFLPSDPTGVLAQIGLEMVYRQYVQTSQQAPPAT